MTTEELKAKFIAEIERLKAIADYQLENYKVDRSAWNLLAEVCKKLLSFINSLPEEPVSEDLEEVSTTFADVHVYATRKVCFKAGAKWQKVKSIVDVCYHLEMRLPEHLDYNGVRVERKDFIEDFKKTLNED